MPEQLHHDHPVTLSSYLQVLRRRKWIILAALVVVPLAAIAFSLHQRKLYEAQAQVLLQQQNLAAQLTGTTQPSSSSAATADQTQADLARVSEIAARVLRRVPGTGLTPGELLADSSVSLATNADLLTFSVTNPSPELASRLVNAYAGVYTVYRRQLDTRSIKKALASVSARIGELKGAHEQGSALYAALVEREQTLQTMQALQTSNSSVVQYSSSAARTQPKTVRNTVLGLLLGLVLGIGLAFLRDSLDTQVRSAEEIGERLGRVPLLARVPAPPKRLADRRRLAMVGEPYGPHAEVFRVLRTNLDFVSLGREMRTIMITSAVEQEGKSTTIANLAVALARAGKHVVLVDLDLRRPTLDVLFGLEERRRGRERHVRPGVTQVVLDYASLDEALVPIALTESPSLGAHVGNGNGNGNGHGRVGGLLEVLPSGSIPPDPGEFVGTRALANVLTQLRQRADVVLIDAPPVLGFGDALALSARVDGIMLAARIKLARRNVLHELARQVATVPTPVLGVVVTDAGEEHGYGRDYGYGYGYGYERRTFAMGEKAQAGSEA